MNYYNEFDKDAANWLRELIKAGLIPDGDVDERSIEDVRPIELRCYTQCHFFAGIGGWSLALRLAGWPETEPVWTGSCPCQPFSKAGERTGFTDERHLWPAFYHLIQFFRPPAVFGEQVASKDGYDWLDLVRADLEDEKYAFGASDLCAASVGAPHARQRLFWVASDTRNFRRTRLLSPRSSCEMRQGWSFGEMDLRQVLERPYSSGPCHPQPLLRQNDDGLSARVGRLRGYGNAIVPQVAEAFIRAYVEVIDDDL